MKSILTALFLFSGVIVTAQQVDVPVQINLKDGGTIDAKHFGQLKCGTATYMDNYIFIKGMFMNNVTEITNFKDIEKIVLEGYVAQPGASAGNEKGTLIIYRKNGKVFTLEDAEIIMSCYSTGSKYNQIVVQIENPITDKVAETTINTNTIHSIIFK
ncbi:MAG: hypothetical protein JXB34_05530 [Bacteroidales bacterium]|nr:hypothetical protein [Bacteroidales bacterium]